MQLQQLNYQLNKLMNSMLHGILFITKYFSFINGNLINVLSVVQDN
jgi:hypothetical protein